MVTVSLVCSICFNAHIFGLILKNDHSVLVLYCAGRLNRCSLNSNSTVNSYFKYNLCSNPLVSFGSTVFNKGVFSGLNRDIHSLALLGNPGLIEAVIACYCDNRAFDLFSVCNICLVDLNFMILILILKDDRSVFCLLDSTGGLSSNFFYCYLTLHVYRKLDLSSYTLISLRSIYLCKSIIAGNNLKVHSLAGNRRPFLNSLTCCIGYLYLGTFYFLTAHVGLVYRNVMLLKRVLKNDHSVLILYCAFRLNLCSVYSYFTICGNRELDLCSYCHITFGSAYLCKSVLTGLNCDIHGVIFFRCPLFNSCSCCIGYLYLGTFYFLTTHVGLFDLNLIGFLFVIKLIFYSPVKA